MATSPPTSSSSMQTAVYHQYQDGRSHMDYYHHSGYGRGVIDDASPAGSRYPSTRDLSVQRRPSAGSNLGADNRRLAIVELDSETSSPSSSIQTPSSSTSPYSSSSTNLFARRGQDRSRLALVAPPDVDAHYSISNPPQSAPVKPRQVQQTPKASHNRSNSEIPRHSGHTTPRAGIQSSHTVHAISPLHIKGRDRRDLVVDTVDLSNEPSALSARGWTVEDDIITPSIGEPKDIDTKVAGPKVVGLGVEEMWRVGREGEDSPPSSDDSHYSGDNSPAALREYLGYDPTIHATTILPPPNLPPPNPLPPPPRFTMTAVSTPPPPRPPRLHSPQPSPSVRPKQILSEAASQPATQRLAPVPLKRGESDYSIDAVTASSYDGVSDDDRHASEGPRPGSSNSNHVREGAFPAASVFLSHPHTSATATPRPPSPASVGSTSEGTFEEEPPSPPKLTKMGHSRASSAQHLPRPASRASSHKSKSLSRAPSVREIVPPPPPPTEISHDMHSQSFGKRLSNMARPASRSFAIRQSFMPRKRKAKSSAWPAAMNFADVLREKSTLARFKMYASKTNELVNEDCGLTEWIMSIKTSRNPPLPTSPRRPSVGPGSHLHNRFVSDGSEVTFPIRADASTAIDLTHRPNKDSPPTAPTLPYPSLAQGVGLRTPGQSVTNMKSISAKTFTLASPSGSAKTLPKSSGSGTGFFASIGRKASMKRAATLIGHGQTSSDLGHGGGRSPPRQPRKLQSSKSQSKPPQSQSARSNPTSPRTQFSAPPPMLPGGPRAPKRSSTTAVPVKGNQANAQLSPPRSSLDSPGSSSVPNESKMRRSTRTGSFHATSSHLASLQQSQQQEAVPPVPRSSLTYRNPYAQRDAGIEQFKANLEKLCDVLPTVDRDILSGYLKRAGGQDILAIGAYLEDEKKGKVKRP